MQNNLHKDHINQTVIASIEQFYLSERTHLLSHQDFLFFQLHLLKKRWLIIQTILMVSVYLFLKFSPETLYFSGALGIAACLFIIFMIPDLWRERNVRAHLHLLLFSGTCLCRKNDNHWNLRFAAIVFVFFGNRIDHKINDIYADYTFYLAIDCCGMHLLLSALSKEQHWKLCNDLHMCICFNFPLSFDFNFQNISKNQHQYLDRSGDSLPDIPGTVDLQTRPSFTWRST